MVAMVAIVAITTIVTIATEKGEDKKSDVRKRFNNQYANTDKQIKRQGLA